MDVRSIQSSPVSTGTVRNRGGHMAPALPADSASPAVERTPVLSTDEKSFFEGLFPESRKDIRAHQAYSGTGEQQKSAPTGTLVDRKG
jgi:hypothetical protein